MLKKKKKEKKILSAGSITALCWRERFENTGAEASYCSSVGTIENLETLGGSGRTANPGLEMGKKKPCRRPLYVLVLLA